MKIKPDERISKVEGFNYILKKSDKVIGLVYQEGVILNNKIDKEVLNKLLDSFEIILGRNVIMRKEKDEL